MTENYGHTSASGNASSHSSSSLNSSLQDTEDDQTIARILAEEESLKNGNKLGKRLSHLNSIPHTPRVNGEIPDVNDATLDHERLAERLATYDLAELQIEGDGNCQFRALADQLFRNPDYHKHVRKKVVKQFGAKICLITSFRDTCFIEINPRDGNPTRELWLSFWSEVHYNSLYASGDVPSRAPRKRHWLF
ncbi:OVARIAN TUMOR DOMAIN-containing deubiquitinating enzyme 11 isoform X3 [Vitis riparia]|uniref:OVARIAN TUMOR DOMAIN-containing deubiquitinating enzyme 11 isoform X3 n=1 Tax=Vitis riparia TaxID=96939 RepID=UPI00155ABF90|nr:OVARIAN TUMOR DOMAIN-containing deubiquitinating enzyme 11 isoform X3 [Vitis riparia]